MAKTKSTFVCKILKLSVRMGIRIITEIKKNMFRADWKWEGGRGWRKRFVTSEISTDRKVARLANQPHCSSVMACLLLGLTTGGG